MGQGLFIAFFLFLLIGILALYAYKASIQLQYLRIQKGKKPGKRSDFFRFNTKDHKAREIRMKAFLLFPLMYAVVLDDEKDALRDIKRQVKSIHIFIYLILVVLIILSILSEKVFVA
jgi:hypothetical protein